MPAAQLAANCPRSFGLYNFATGAVEALRVRSVCAAMDRAIELRTGCSATTRGMKPVARKGDGQVREVVGFDGQGRAWMLKLSGDLTVTRENPHGYVFDRQVPALRRVK